MANLNDSRTIRNIPFYTTDDTDKTKLISLDIPTGVAVTVTGTSADKNKTLLSVKGGKAYIETLSVDALSSPNEIQAPSFYSTSDKRLKENIKPFVYGESILNLPIYTFDFKEGPKNQIGCLAQDLQELYPELVKEDDKGVLSIQENKLVYLLLEEIKTLTKRVEELEKR